MLDNHTLLLEVLHQEINKCQHGDQHILAVLVVNLNNSITKIDGILGYDAGDQLLQQIGSRLKSILRGRDIPGFISRNELACILPSITSEGYIILAAHKILRTLEEPFMLAGRPVFINVSLGISHYPELGKDAGNLLKQANVAMHEAKHNNSPYIIYQAQHDLLSQLQFEIHTDLSSAIHNSELFLCYQPQMDLRTGQISGTEALLRWNNAARDNISPSAIISVAENTGLISALTAWVFNAALRQQSLFRRAGMDLSISVNFSARNLAEPELPTFVTQVLETWDVPPDKVVIEITERTMIEDEKRSLAALSKLKDIGIRLSLDDFGTGYASMSHLRKMPVDEIKVDISFVKDMLFVKDDERIVRSIIALGRNFDLEVVAEGVENKATMDKLLDLGCDKIQGNYISPAVCEGEIEEIVSRYHNMEPC
ncbi:MAG: GGDEF domain-containing phosphodiesterase [Gammaproteobacteria bacterium]